MHPSAGPPDILVLVNPDSRSPGAVRMDQKLFVAGSVERVGGHARRVAAGFSLIGCVKSRSRQRAADVFHQPISADVVDVGLIVGVYPGTLLICKLVRGSGHAFAVGFLNRHSMSRPMIGKSGRHFAVGFQIVPLGEDGGQT